MTRFMNIILASAALATALTPIAANATIMTPLQHVQIEAHKAVSGPLPEVQTGPANQMYPDSLTYRPVEQTIVQSGTVNQMYPDSIGG
jgi:hypothetical protein